MNKIIFGLLFFSFILFFRSECNAQQFKIVAAEDGSVLPYATVINYTHPTIVSANANGIVELNPQNGDSIAVSYVGFKTLSFIFYPNFSPNIRIFKENNVLPPITVLKCKKFKKMKYSNEDSTYFKISENGERLHFGGVLFSEGPWNNPQFAVRLNPEQENAIMKEFSFWLLKPYGGPKSAITAPLIIDFYDVTDSILPGNLLTEKSLIYYPQKPGKQTLKLDSLHLRIPSNGIFVSFQCVRNEDYAWTETTHWIDSASHISKDSVFERYGGRIDGIYTRNFELADFNPIKNKWYLWSYKPGKNDIHGSIKCEAVLKYCED